jgi:hypothetical protein
MVQYWRRRAVRGTSILIVFYCYQLSYNFMVSFHVRFAKEWGLYWMIGSSFQMWSEVTAYSLWLFSIVRFNLSRSFTIMIYWLWFSLFATILDRKLLRVLRGFGHDINKVCEVMTSFLAWRDEQGVDEIRESIIRGGKDHPLKFPSGEKVSFYMSSW